MANRAISLWTCDRCGKEERVANGDAAPAGWQVVGAVSAEDQENDTSASRWELCGPCYSQVERLLQPTNRPVNWATRRGDATNIGTAERASEV